MALSGSARGARWVAAPLAFVAMTLTACSSSSTPSAATRPSTTPSARPSADATAVAALVRAEHSVTTTVSFRFVATEVLSGGASHATTVRGEVVRAQGVAYTLTTNGRTSQVVRIKGATFVRTVPGAWKKLRKPQPVVDPVGSLLAVLRGLVVTGDRRDGTAVVVTGGLPAAAAASAQIPTSGAGGQAPQVAVTVDASGDVTRLVVTTAAPGGVTSVTLTTTYSGFGAVLPLRAPV